MRFQLKEGPPLLHGGTHPADQSCWIPGHDTAGIDALNDDGSGADHHPVPYGDRAEDHGIHADIHAVTEHWHSLAGGPLTDRHAVAKGASGTHDRALMHHKTDAMLKGKPRADRSLVIKLDAHQPMDEQDVKSQQRQPKDPETER